MEREKKGKRRRKLKMEEKYKGEGGKRHVGRK